MNNKRQEQKKLSRVKNDITTMQLSRSINKRVERVRKFNGFDKKDEALDEMLSFYEEHHPKIMQMELDGE